MSSQCSQAIHTNIYSYSGHVCLSSTVIVLQSVRIHLSSIYNLIFPITNVFFAGILVLNDSKRVYNSLHNVLTCLSQYPLALNRQFRKVIAIYCRSFTIHTLSDVMLCHFGFKTAVLKLAEGVHNSLYVIQVTELASGISSVNLSTRLHFEYNVLRLKLEKFKIRFDLKKIISRNYVL